MAPSTCTGNCSCTSHKLLFDSAPTGQPRSVSFPRTLTLPLGTMAKQVAVNLPANSDSRGLLEMRALRPHATQRNATWRRNLRTGLEARGSDSAGSKCPTLIGRSLGSGLGVGFRTQGIGKGQGLINLQYGLRSSTYAFFIHCWELI